jgi:hypothetical protein
MNSVKNIDERNCRGHKDGKTSGVHGLDKFIYIYIYIHTHIYTCVYIHI